VTYPDNRDRGTDVHHIRNVGPVLKLGTDIRVKDHGYPKKRGKKDS
jgi:hypothetical protein